MLIDENFLRLQFLHCYILGLVLSYGFYLDKIGSVDFEIVIKGVLGGGFN